MMSEPVWTSWNWPCRNAGLDHFGQFAGEIDVRTFQRTRLDGAKAIRLRKTGERHARGAWTPSIPEIIYYFLWPLNFDPQRLHRKTVESPASVRF